MIERLGSWLAAAVKAEVLIWELGRMDILTIRVGAHAVLIQAPTFDCPTNGGGYPEPSNGFKVIAMGHRKSAPGLFWRRCQHFQTPDGPGLGVRYDWNFIKATKLVI